MGWLRGAVALTILASAACQGGATAPETPTIAAAASASAPPAAARPRVAAPVVPAAAAPTSARRIEIAGLILADPVAGQPPTAAHPKGTVIVLGYAAKGKDTAGLVELDVATGAEIKRSKITVEGRARLVREGDSIHVAAASASSFVWVTTDLALEEKRRVAPKKSPAAVDDRTFVGFAVLDGNAAIVSSSRGALVELLDDKGKTLAKHDCKAGVGTLGEVPIERAGSVAILGGLFADQSVLACGFRVDGTGAPIRKKHPIMTSFFAHDGVAYATDAEIRRLDGALAATGPVVSDPRPCSDPHSACAMRCAGGLSGEATVQMLMIADVLVERTVGCCGGTPGGLFFCDPSAQKPADRILPSEPPFTLLGTAARQDASR